MNPPFAFRQWRSCANPETIGIELLGSPVDPGSVCQGLDSLVARLDLGHASFVLMRLAPTDDAGIRTALSTAFASFEATDIRVCFAVDRWTLSRLGGRGLDSLRAGLLLDDVDGDTPPAALTHEAIEAIRFRPEFVASAVRRLRLGCALEASLGLARALGLAVLGPAVSKPHAMPGIAFDYSPMSADDPRAWIDRPPGSDAELVRPQQELELRS